MRKPKVLTYRGMGMALVSENKVTSPERERELFDGIFEQLYGRKVTWVGKPVSRSHFIGYHKVSSQHVCDSVEQASH